MKDDERTATQGPDVAPPTIDTAAPEPLADPALERRAATIVESLARIDAQHPASASGASSCA